MGEKGNISSDELIAAGSGAVVAGAGTQVTAVFEEAGATIKDKVLDKGADAGLTAATEKWQHRHGDSQDGESAPPTTS